MAAKVNINLEELGQLISAVESYVEDTKTLFINPCTEALRTCGLSGDFMKEIDPLADEVFNTLNDTNNTLGQETGSPDGSVLDALKSFAEDSRAELEKSVFGGIDLQTQTVEVQRKKRTSI